MSFQVQSLWEHHIKLSVQSSPVARANLSIDSSEPLEKSHGGLCFIPSEHISSQWKLLMITSAERPSFCQTPKPKCNFQCEDTATEICGKITFLPVVLDCDWPTSCASSVLAGMNSKSQDPKTDPSVCIYSGIFSKRQKERNSTRTK